MAFSRKLDEIRVESYCKPGAVFPGNGAFGTKNLEIATGSKKGCLRNESSLLEETVCNRPFLIDAQSQNRYNHSNSINKGQKE